MRTVTVHSLDGKALATALLQGVPGGQTLSLDRVIAGKGELLHHYFSDGLRIVLLDLDGLRSTGVLSTRWLNGERRWFVELRPSEAGSYSCMGKDGVQHHLPPQATEVGTEIAPNWVSWSGEAVGSLPRHNASDRPDSTSPTSPQLSGANRSA